MGGYVGITDDYGVYEVREVTETMTASNINEFFTVNNGNYYFAGNGSVFTSNNGGINNSTAQTELTALFDMTVSFNYSYSTEPNYDKLTLIVGTTTIENGVSGVNNKSHSCTINAGDVIKFTYAKDNSTHTNADKCTFSNMVVTCNKKTLVGTVRESRARNLKKGYVGVGNKARAITKGYVGVAGKARPCFTGGKLTYFGTVDGLSVARCYLGAATTKSYALFKGGTTTQSSNQAVSTLDVYDSLLTKTSYSNMGYNMGSTGVSFADYAFFAGGQWDGDNSNNISVFNDTLTRTNLTLNYRGSIKIGGAKIGSSYALFIGSDSSTAYQNNGTAIDSNLTIKSTPALSAQRNYIGSASVGGYAVFAGGAFGTSNQPYDNVDAYNDTLTQTTVSSLKTARYDAAGCSMKDYALFGGGHNGSNSVYYSDVDCYDDTLSKINVNNLSAARMGLSGVGLERYGIFAGGFNGTCLNTVDVYDESLVKMNDTSLNKLNEARTDLGGTLFGDYVLFAGGYNNSYSPSATVDVYTVK